MALRCRIEVEQDAIREGKGNDGRKKNEDELSIKKECDPLIPLMRTGLQ